MNFFVIYDNPTDYPDTYVVRRWEVAPPKNDPIAMEVFMIDKNLNKIRKELRNMGLYRVPRYENDDKKIVETWL